MVVIEKMVEDERMMTMTMTMAMTMMVIIQVIINFLHPGQKHQIISLHHPFSTLVISHSSTNK